MLSSEIRWCKKGQNPPAVLTPKSYCTCTRKREKTVSSTSMDNGHLRYGTHSEGNSSYHGTGSVSGLCSTLKPQTNFCSLPRSKGCLLVLKSNANSISKPKFRFLHSCSPCR